MGYYQSRIKLIDFLSSFQNFIVSSDTDSNMAIQDNTPKINPNKNKAHLSSTENFISLCWDLPDKILKLFGKRGAEETIVPPLPVEFLKEVKVPSRALYDELSEHFSILNIHLSDLHFKISIDCGGEKNNDATIAHINPSFRAHFSEFSSKIRMARSIVFGIQTFRKENNLFRTNFDLSVHRVWAFLNGYKIDLKKTKIDSSLKKIEKSFRTLSQKHGYKISFASTRKPDNIGPDEIIKAIEEVNYANQSILPLMPTELKKGDIPDSVLFRPKTSVKYL